MLSFPILSTGAVTQYPVVITSGQATQVIAFLDGTDQRYRLQGRSLRMWQIRLEALNEDETHALEDFFDAQMGDYSPFSFPDPYSGNLVPNCRFAEAGLESQYTGVDTAATNFWIVETNG